jgi:uncharacterized membrane protein YbhN (UPF0104 family)
LPSAVIRRVLLLGITAVSLYLLAPALTEVFGSFPEVADLSPLWFAAMVLLQVGSYACMWGIQRLALRDERWGPVMTSQLAANAFGRIVPGGLAAAGALQYAMLVRAGVPAARAASGMTASSLLVFGVLLGLPVLALPAIIAGAPVNRGLERAGVAGGVMFALIFAGGAWSFVSDRPLRWLGGAFEAVHNQLLRRREALTGVSERLIGERDLVRRTLGERWWEALLYAGGRWVLDYLSLLCALTAVGADPRPSLVLLAFVAAQTLGTLPLTPGGLGFVEAGLTGTLALAGVPGAQAVVATLAYRLVSFWLPIPAGGVAAVMHRRRYGVAEVEEPPAPAPSARRG